MFEDTLVSTSENDINVDVPYLYWLLVVNYVDVCVYLYGVCLLRVIEVAIVVVISCVKRFSSMCTIG